MARWNSTMPIAAAKRLARRQPLERSLEWPILTLLGLGAILQFGALTWIGVGLAQAGPNLLIALAIAGLVYICVALAYAEMAAMAPVAGSAYSYAYAALGELAAWIVGWGLILEFSLLAASYAAAWSGYVSALMSQYGYALPKALSVPLAYEGIVDMPAALIIAAVGGLLAWRVRVAMILNAALVLVILLLPLVLFALHLALLDPASLPEYRPADFRGGGEKAVEIGLLAALGTLSLLFTGFDAVAPAAEEARSPRRAIPIAILGSTIVAVILLAVLAAAALASLEYWHAEQDSLILRSLFDEWASGTFGVSLRAWGVAAVPAALFAVVYAQSRILHTMARDRLLPPWLEPVSSGGNPRRATLFTAAVAVAIASVMPFKNIDGIAAAGMLTASLAVSLALLVMRLRAGRLPRPFRAPLAWPVGLIGMAGCAFAFVRYVPGEAMLTFLLWLGGGVVAYFLYGKKRSFLAVFGQFRDEGAGEILS